MRGLNVTFTVYYEFPEGHENYREFGDSEIRKNEMEARDLMDELIEEGATYITITATEDFGGMVASQEMIEEWGEPQ